MHDGLCPRCFVLQVEGTNGFEACLDITAGTVFAEALKSKTTLTADSQSRFLPYVALSTGVTFADWSDVWLQARESEGLSFGAFALPSYSERECAWIEARMSSSEATVWLREFLKIAGTLPEGLSRVGSHSCKSTVLTWAGRSTHIKFRQAETLGASHEPGRQKHVDLQSGSLYLLVRESSCSFQVHREWRFRT